MPWVGDREKASQAGCDDYDTKPVDLQRLVAKIVALLEPGDESDDDPAGLASLLIVDDEELNRDMLGRAPGVAWIPVTFAEDGQQALDMIERPGLRSGPPRCDDARSERLAGPAPPPRDPSAGRAADHHGDRQEPE